MTTEAEVKRRSAEQEALKILNRALNQIVKEDGFTFSRSANYRYYASKRTTSKSRAKDKYFWTTQRVDGKFISGIYRYQASTKRWTAKMKRSHRKRSDAKARALKLSREEK